MIYDRPMWPPRAEIQAQAFDRFQAWLEKRDPNEELDLLKLVDEYASEMKEPPVL